LVEKTLGEQIEPLVEAASFFNQNRGLIDINGLFGVSAANLDNPAGTTLTSGKAELIVSQT
jgi:hypothetical protein